MRQTDQVVCVVPCAGEGVRLRPLTFSRPKHLLPLCNAPVIDHVLSALRQAGIRQVAVIGGPTADALRDHIAGGARWGLAVEWLVQPEPRGIADAVLLAEEFVAGRPFVVYLGDNVFGDGVTGFVRRFVEGLPAGLLRLREVEDPRRYGVAVTEGDVVTALVEKPAEPPSKLAITGLYGLPPELFAAIGRIQPSARGELEITDAIQELIRGRHAVRAELWEGPWEDVGEPRSFLKANRLLLEAVSRDTASATVRQSDLRGAVGLGADTVVEGSLIIGPVLVGRGCRIVDSQVGPHVSIGDGAVVEGSRVRESILDGGASVVGQQAYLEHSILGLRARVEGNGQDGEAAQVVVGDGEAVRTG